MKDGTISKFLVLPGAIDDTVILLKGVVRTVKKKPNRLDIMRRVFVSVSKDKAVSTVL